MTDLEKLLAIKEIRQLRPKYWRLIDAKQFDQLEELFTEDAWFDSVDAVCDPVKGQYPGFPVFPVSYGRANLIQRIIDGMPPELQSSHMGNTGEIEITSDTTAKGVSSLYDRLLIPGVLAASGYGYYFDEYEKVDGKWRIKGTVLKRKRVVFEDDLGNGVDLSGKNTDT